MVVRPQSHVVGEIRSRVAGVDGFRQPEDGNGGRRGGGEGISVNKIVDLKDPLRYVERSVENGESGSHL